LTMTQESGGIGLQLVAGHGRDRDLLRFVESCPIFRNSKRLPLAEL
jgi:hypothetical protein